MSERSRRRISPTLCKRSREVRSTPSASRRRPSSPATSSDRGAPRRLFSTRFPIFDVRRRCHGTTRRLSSSATLSRRSRPEDDRRRPQRRANLCQSASLPLSRYQHILYNVTIFFSSNVIKKTKSAAKQFKRSHTFLRSSFLRRVFDQQLVSRLEVRLVPLVRSDPTLRNEISSFLQRRV